MPDETTPAIVSASTAPAQNEPTGAVGSALMRQGASHNRERVTQEILNGKSQISAAPMQLDVTVPIPNFRVEDLLALEKGAVVETCWPQTDDVPVWCGGAQLVWAEFEVLGQKLAVRVTRLR